MVAINFTQYDTNGNRTGIGISTGAHNRLTSDATFTYLYDNEGNLIRKTAKVGTNSTDYTYDHRNRLTRVVHVGPLALDDAYDVSYTYDADDRLVSREWHYNPGNPQNVDSLQMEHFLYQGTERVLTFDGENNQLKHRTLWGPVNNQLLVDEVFGSTGLLQDTLWAVTDHLGTVTDLITTAGSEIVEHREYDAFGALDAAYDEMGVQLSAGIPTGYQTTLRSEVGFAGQHQDRATGLSQNAARWYDPATGRFMSEDPIREGANHYRYAGNDPINFSDPTGLSQAGNPLNALAGRNASAGRSIIPISTFNNTGYNTGPTTNLRDFAFGSSYNVGAGTNLQTIANQPIRNDLIVADPREVQRNRNPFRDPILVGANAVLSNPRVQGGLKIAQGLGEGSVAIGLAGAPDPTLVTKAGAGVVGLKALDSLQAGARQLFYGNSVSTVTQAVATNAARGLGASPYAANIIGGVVDAAPGLVGGAGLLLRKATTGLSTRAEQIHSILDPIAQGRRTTAVVQTANGQRIVGGGMRDLTPAQRVALLPNEVAARLPGAHAEITALQYVIDTNLTPSRIATTRVICPECRTYIEALGGTITSPKTATFR